MGWKDDDSDGLTDVLDTNPGLNWAPGTISSIVPGNSYVLAGTAVDQPMPPVNPFYPPVSINAIKDIQYRVNGGAWQAGRGSVF